MFFYFFNGGVNMIRMDVIDKIIDLVKIIGVEENLSDPEWVQLARNLKTQILLPLVSCDRPEAVTNIIEEHLLDILLLLGFKMKNRKAEWEELKKEVLRHMENGSKLDVEYNEELEETLIDMALKLAKLMSQIKDYKKILEKKIMLLDKVIESERCQFNGKEQEPPRTM